MIIVYFLICGIFNIIFYRIQINIFYSLPNIKKLKVFNLINTYFKPPRLHNILKC